MKYTLSVLVPGLAAFLFLSPSFAAAATIPVTQSAQLEMRIQDLLAQLSVLQSSQNMAAAASAASARVTNSGATVSQTSVKSSGGTFTLSGTAPSANSVFVALVASGYAGPTDWHTIYVNHSYAAFTGDSVTKVKRGKWTARFIGVPQGAYKVLLYENDDSFQTLLATGRLGVSADAVAKFRSSSSKPIILGVGQSATDGGVTVQLMSAGYSNGTTGTAVARFLITSKGYAPAYYEGGIGEKIPQGGGIGDSRAKNGGVTITVTDIVPSMNAATILVKADAAKG